jgi:mRNA interferase HigB
MPVISVVEQAGMGRSRVGNFIVFNIGGNNYRLITYPDYESQLIFVRAVLTHAEYDKETWKNDDWFEST